MRGQGEFNLAVDAFVRSVAVNRARPLCLFLGAGASISSGMPSAERCIWEWKQDIFATNNPTLRATVGELSLPGTRRRIQQWLDQRGQYPHAGARDEYSFYAKECYPTNQDRRVFFQSYVAQSKPHTGYRLLPLLAKAGSLRSVWTTNFDGLVARAAAAADLVCIEIGIDAAAKCDSIGAEPMLASILSVIFFMSLAPRIHGLDDALIQLPVFGVVYELFRKETYYRHDTQLMYLEIVPRIVQHQIEEFTRAAGVKAVETKHCSTCRPLDLRNVLQK